MAVRSFSPPVFTFICQLEMLVDSHLMRLDALDYRLPPDQIAQRPLGRRDASRLFELSRREGSLNDHLFADLPNLLRGDELIVLNNARVIPARLFGRREGVHSQPPSRTTRHEYLTGKVEVFLTRQVDSQTWEALVRPGRKMQTGERIQFGDGELAAEVISRGELGLRTLRFVSRDTSGVSEHLERLGHIPLPPYIHRTDEVSDRERYQTVFAKQPGAIAAPTAGLHFTPEVLDKIRARGVEICELTLDVGLGTFQPVHAETLEDHLMHAESYEIPIQTVQSIQQARFARRPILAVGTTVVRALEAAALRAAESGSPELLLAGKAYARLFIYPGFHFRVVDALLTNFHLPRSTLLALVCAFAGRENVLAAYNHAVQAGYRFYSYGDCMLIR
ncbi:MAG TPA: tRNA preQ1(34) S-adenosylmethionine ribosyltransferase-isomerase QueA [Candidatus Acidoferrum sp.]|jgi:S-adenosylmethionine:tRNA ribosyltransferase-isomerase|nr:tRNA preQ1(34) S-adenosylmethionine ribosyltransferase-isomerase QueA [Candidatus Acidoferrum sp.]